MYDSTVVYSCSVVTTGYSCTGYRKAPRLLVLLWFYFKILELLVLLQMWLY
jgi:hypothetical protein